MLSTWGLGVPENGGSTNDTLLMNFNNFLVKVAETALKNNIETIVNQALASGNELSGEDANNRNLITGTRYMNTEGMLPFENMVADYIKETGNHVMYRVTPLYKGNNLLAHGVQMEAYSIEDNGKGVCFNVYIYNVQPGIKIDYVTGNSSKEQ